MTAEDKLKAEAAEAGREALAASRAQTPEEAEASNLRNRPALRKDSQKH